MSKRHSPAMLGAILLSATLPASAFAHPSLNFSDATATGTPGTVLQVSEPAGEGHGGHDSDAPMPEMAAWSLGDLTIDTVFSRATVARSGGAFLVIENLGDTADRLIAAHTEVAARTELHEMTVENDVMRMHEVEGGIEVPAHGTATLAPGGLHVMMMGLSGPLEQGQTFDLTLTFEQAGEITLTVPVMAPAADGMHGHDAD